MGEDKKEDESGERTYVTVGLDGGLDAHVRAQGDLRDVVEELQAVQFHGLCVLHHGLMGGEIERGWRIGGDKRW